MSRVIKFRVWDGKHKEMRVVDAMLRSGQVMCGEDAFEPDALMQFTGLTDKNGRDVYEGDILKDPDGLITEVIWWEDKAGFDTMDAMFRPWNKCEVIGDIYSNPELLTDKGV